MESSTKWESSYFGGYHKVLLDYPEVKVPFDIERELPKSIELSGYSANKLLDIFLLKIKENKLIDHFLDKATSIERKNPFSGQEEKFLSVSETAKKNVLDSVAKDTELGNLFTHYRSIIEKSEFLFPMNDGKENGEGKGEEGDEGEGQEDSRGEGGGEDEGDSGEMSIEAALDNARELIEKVIPRRTKWLDVEGSICEMKDKVRWRVVPSKGAPCKYNELENLYAGHLVNLLDISFDPQHDRVNGLKTGKLDSRKLAEVKAGNFHVYYNEQENQTTKPFSVCILMDESGSMGGIDGKYHSTKADSQHSIMKILWKCLSSILPADKIFVYGHSTNDAGMPHINIYNDKYNHIFERAIGWQRNAFWSGNYDGPVIEAIYDKVRSFTDDNIIFIVISDGLPCASGYGGRSAVMEMKQTIEKCKRDGFVTVGVGVELGQVKEIYTYHTIVTNLDDMAKQVSTLLNTVVKTEFQ